VKRRRIGLEQALAEVEPKIRWLVRTYLPSFRGTAWGEEDLRQEAVLVVIELWPSYDRSRGVKLSTWVGVIVANRFNDLAMKEKRRPVQLGEIDPPTAGCWELERLMWGDLPDRLSQDARMLMEVALTPVLGRMSDWEAPPTERFRRRIAQQLLGGSRPRRAWYREIGDQLGWTPERARCSARELCLTILA
jgi:DNA-directed RNA polymerase specialized sigma24 family protein